MTPPLAPIVWKPLIKPDKIDGIKLNTFPNPATKEVTIEYTLEADQYGTLEVIDLTGRVVKNLLKGILSKGTTQQVVSLQNLANGIYLVRLNTANGAFVQKFSVVQ